MLLQIIPSILLILLFFQTSPARIPTIPPYNPQEEATIDLPIPFVEPRPRPINTKNVPPPTLTARGILVMDVDSATILMEKNADQRLYPASTTKMMTALITLEQCDLDDIVTITALDTDDENTQMGLILGEHITVESLLYGLLLNSGNDAARALATHCGPGLDTFIQQMNTRAQELGLRGTNFTNTTGLHNPEHITTARDLAVLARLVLDNPTLAAIVKTDQFTVSNVEETQWHTLQNRNLLLDQRDDVIGIKTGWTAEAGENLVVAAERDGRRIITVVLGSDDRFGETAALLDWVWENHSWEITSTKYQNTNNNQ